MAEMIRFSVKELRSRMRGARAFVFLTIICWFWGA